MPESVSDRSLRGLAVPTLATLALVLVLVAGTFAALLVSVRDAQHEADGARHAEEILTHAAPPCATWSTSRRGSAATC